MTVAPAPLEVRRLGCLPYAETLELQASLVAERQAGQVSDLLLLVEHPHVVTLGVGARHDLSNLLVAPTELEARGVDFFEAPRGGDVTYHGPGQLVGYPILDLRPDRCDVHQYVRDLEEVLIQTVQVFGVEASRVAGLSGVWVGTNKLAAIGVRISRWVTSHGFALNVTTDLDYFALIRPCGISDRGVTSLAQLLEDPPPRARVEAELVGAFERVFGRRALVAARPTPA